MNHSWCVYLIKSFKDGSIYTGVSTDYKRRIKEHNAGRGAKYTRGRGPWHLMAVYIVSTKSEALKKEFYIKSLSKEQKIDFCRNSLECYKNGRPLKNAYWYATNFGPDVVSVQMSAHNYADIRKYGRDVLDQETQMITIKTGLMAHIFGIEIRVKRIPDNLTYVMYKDGTIKTLCDFHGWNNNQKCNHIDCVVKEIHES